MSEHSTEELKRQLDAAGNRRMAAETEEHNARVRYRARLVEEKLAEYAAHGITPGCKVVAICRRYDGTQRRTPATFIGVEASWSDQPTVILGALKADGSPSKARRNIVFDRLEPFPTEVPHSETTR